MKGCNPIEKECKNCKNLTNHVAWKEPVGFQAGFIFKPDLVGKKKYYLVCSVCTHPEREITKSEALSMVE